VKQRSYEKVGTLRLSYVSVIAQVGKRGQGNSEGGGFQEGRAVGSRHSDRFTVMSRV